MAAERRVREKSAELDDLLQLLSPFLEMFVQQVDADVAADAIDDFALPRGIVRMRPIAHRRRVRILRMRQEE